MFSNNKFVTCLHAVLIHTCCILCIVNCTQACIRRIHLLIWTLITKGTATTSASGVSANKPPVCSRLKEGNDCIFRFSATCYSYSEVDAPRTAWEILFQTALNNLWLFLPIVLVVFTYFISISSRMSVCPIIMYRSFDKSLARPWRKEARKYVRDARDFNSMEKRDVIKFFFLQGKAPKEIHSILTELACFLPARAKDLSAPLYVLVKPLWWTHFCHLFFIVLFIV